MRTVFRGGKVFDGTMAPLADADVVIEDGRIDTRPWVTHRCAFDSLAESFPAYTKPETGVIKAMVEVG